MVEESFWLQLKLLFRHISIVSDSSNIQNATLDIVCLMYQIALHKLSEYWLNNYNILKNPIQRQFSTSFLYTTESNRNKSGSYSISAFFWRISLSFGLVTGTAMLVTVSAAKFFGTIFIYFPAQKNIDWRQHQFRFGSAFVGFARCAGCQVVLSVAVPNEAALNKKMALISRLRRMKKKMYLLLEK